ncbi:MAG: hypothetical protein RMX96_24350 [Nostoc sp. ChiSLP02]|nr:hypothetical protein [Nostoc sp. DedSLP05]MDZ8097948.1 hypothetical protein [Nostoc sp. DedSLP01]MDZ8187969.1 hypothetical protein [Nostoc sp. ChiSLP02]
MFDFNSLTEFSRNNCVAICTFLVPANLLFTILTMVLTALRRPSHQIWQSAAIASFFASVMILHVYTWFMIGVVMAPTYILMSLAISCLLTNSAAILVHRRYAHTPNLSNNA